MPPVPANRASGNPSSSCRSWLLIPRWTGLPVAPCRSVACSTGTASLGDSRSLANTPTRRSGHATGPDGPDSQAHSTTFFCLRRGLGLKDGPGSARAATVSAWLRQGFILSPSARTGLAGLARYPEGGRRREDEPPGEVWRVRQYRETTSTRATRTHAVPFACPREAETRDTDRMPGTSQTTTDQGSGSRLQGARRPPKR
jgi:hypothetical protein